MGVAAFWRRELTLPQHEGTRPPPRSLMQMSDPTPFYVLYSTVFSTVGVATQQQVVDGLPSSCSARNTGSGGTLVISMAEAVGARAAAPEELLGHFVRAGGGDVDKAAALYRDVADEFVELREIARRVGGEGEVRGVRELIENNQWGAVAVQRTTFWAIIAAQNGKQLWTTFFRPHFFFFR